MSEKDSITVFSMPEVMSVGHASVVEIEIDISDSATKHIIDRHKQVYISYHWYNEDMSVYEWDNNRETIHSATAENQGQLELITYKLI